ncbi:MAG: hypothetical protein C5T88_00565 [Williamsoniiplasma luminosum]|uniref:Uncharacterized protein n=1 Tax=Williamsoniiplasma luminosum TaxID=214888 RepID=A0A2S0NJ88_9MOLU|nr:MAG: hypothetical protein C5T88_00565 [Williamsoniiplasma luminosum]
MALSFQSWTFCWICPNSTPSFLTNWIWLARFVFNSCNLVFVSNFKVLIWLLFFSSWSFNEVLISKIDLALTSSIKSGLFLTTLIFHLASDLALTFLSWRIKIFFSNSEFKASLPSRYSNNNSKRPLSAWPNSVAAWISFL